MTQPKSRKQTHLRRWALSGKALRHLIDAGLFPEPIAIKWTRQIDSNAVLDRGEMKELVLRYCTHETFGRWAHAVASHPTVDFPPAIVSVIRDSFRRARKEEHAIAIIHAMGRFDDEDQTWSNEYQRVVKLAWLPDVVRYGLEPAFRRGDTDAMEAAVRAAALIRFGGVGRAVRREVEPFLSRVSEVTHSAVEKPIAVPGTGAVLLRGEEARDVDAYLRHSREVQVSADAIHLAIELTYHPIWKLVAEEPFTFRLGRLKASVQVVTVTPGADSLDIRFGMVGGGPTVPTVHLPTKGPRTYLPGTVDHAAAVLVDLMFADTNRLRTTRLDKDRTLVVRLLASCKMMPTAVYRLSSPPVWDPDADESAFLSVTRQDQKTRAAHDTRGHFQTRRGRKVPIRPYRTGRNHDGNPGS